MTMSLIKYQTEKTPKILLKKIFFLEKKFPVDQNRKKVTTWNSLRGQQKDKDKDKEGVRLEIKPFIAFMISLAIKSSKIKEKKTEKEVN